MSADAPVFCVNHPKTETLLRCNKCGKPVCIKCVERTPVGYRCKECLNIQQAGYYTATPLDYAIVAAVSAIASIIAGGIAVTLINWWLIMLFYAPVAGSIIAEIIRRAIQKRRGKYISPLGCAVFIVGGLVGAGALPLVLAWRAHQLDYFWLAFSVFFQLGIWIFIVLGATTVYGRLRS